MTALELYQDTLNQPDVIREAHKLATHIANTDFVPAHFRGKPEAVMAALLTGRELGLGPMTALRHLHVINGKVGFEAKLIRARVLAAGHEMWTEDSGPDRCTVAGRRNGSDKVERVTWTLKDAQTAGLAAKDIWKKYPRQMLVARATAEVAWLIASDAMIGVDGSVEELQDDQPERITRTPRRNTPDPEPAPAAQVITTTATVKAAPSWDDDIAEAELVEPQPADDGDEAAHPQLIPDGPPPATANQVKKAMAMLRGAGIGEDERHALVEVHSGGRTTHIGELSKTEISALIDALTAPAAKPGEEPFA